MKIILCGYDWSGCDALRQLLDMNHEVFVYTHEGPYFTPSLIEYCRSENVVYSLDNISKSTLPFQPDCIASIYYRYIIKRPVIDACQGRIFNLHPSLLPTYRGCSSLTWAMIEGEQQVGFTYHYVDEGCDTGDIIVQQPIELLPYDTQATLYRRVAFRALESFGDAFEYASSGRPGTPQEGTPTHYKRGCPHDGIISADWPREKVARFIRAMVHPPYPVAKFNGSEIHSLADYDQALRQYHAENQRAKVG